VLLLTPKSEAMGVSSITLTLEERGSKVVPTTIAYDYNGDEVTIVLTAVDVANTKLRKWDFTEYPAYDIVSFL
jgi:hypothetical protein